MAKYTPTPLSTTLSNSAAAQINDNLNRISSAIEDGLSRDGSTPNQMESDIDFNNNDALNVGRLDAEELFLGGELVIPGDLGTLPPTVMLKSTYDPQGINGDAFNRGNHTGSQPVTSVTEINTSLKAFDWADPVALFNGDGVTSDTSNFSLLESLVSNREVDLKGQTYLVQDRNANGVPGLYVTGDSTIVGVLWSDQFQTGRKEDGGIPSTFLQRYYIGNDGIPSASGLRQSVGWYGSTPVLAAWPQEDVTCLSAHFNTDGSLVKRTFRRGLRLACVTPNAATGVYVLSFQDADGTAVNLGHTNYYMVATTFSGAHYCEVRAQTSTGFEVRTYDAAGAAVNRQFMIDVRIDNEWADNRD